MTINRQSPSEPFSRPSQKAPLFWNKVGNSGWFCRNRLAASPPMLTLH